VTEPADQPVKPLRTWRPMILWTAGILLALGLVWFVGAVAIPVLRLRAEVHETLPDYRMGESSEYYRPGDETTGGYVHGLGGPERAAEVLANYLRLPGWLAPRKQPAAYVLRHCKQETAGPVLIQVLGTERDGLVRSAAAEALGNFKSEAIAAALRTALLDPSGRVRCDAAFSLWMCTRDTERVVPVLIAGLADPETRIRQVAAQWLANIGTEAQGATAALAAALRDPDKLTRAYAAWALERIGPAAQAAVPALQRSLADEDAGVRSAAAEALKEIRGEEAVK
jgi:HEAT repeat protein